MRLIVRKASVRWRLGARAGARVLTTESGRLTRASFSLAHDRIRKGDTDPVELIAAAHAGSFALALAGELGQKALGSGEALITAEVTLERLPAGWAIANIHLNVVAQLPSLSQGAFIDATLRAKASCLVSRALRPTISMNAKLENASPHRKRKLIPANRPLLRGAGSRRTGNR